MLAGIFALPSIASAQILREDLWVTDGAVEAIAVDTNAIYLGGSFTRVGPLTGGAALLDAGTGVAVGPYSRVEGVVMAVVPDVSGGWYIGGAFTEVGGQPRANLAQLDAAGNVTPWNPGADATVRVLAISGSTVYAGGDFFFAGGQPRNRLAELDAVTGATTAWNPGANWTVNALLVNGGTVYVGGGFSSIGGQARSRIAALDAGTGTPTAWAPEADSDVVALALGSSAMYAGGYFTSIGGQARGGIAALDPATGAATGWAPNADGSVLALGVHEASTFPFTVTVFAGGSFTNIGGQARSYIAALDGVTGSATSWNPGSDSAVNALIVKTNRFGSLTSICAAGNFGIMGGQVRKYIAELDAAGAVTSWNPTASEQVFALAAGFGTVHAGGVFTTIGGVPRNHIAALDAGTGAATSWNPDANGPVRALAVSGGTVYAGGTFSSIGGSSVAINLAALDAATGAALPSWDGDAYMPGDVHELVLHGGTLYVGGDFTILGGQFRNNLGALDAATGAATGWNPGANGAVYALAVAERQSFPFTVTVYAGGEFATLGGQARLSLGAVDGNTAAATSWNPSASSDVYDLLLTTDPFGNVTSVYAAGLFTTIGGQLRNHIAEVDASGAATAWNPNSNLSGTVHALARGGDTIYAGGGFSVIGEQWRSAFAALDVATGLATSWDPDALGTVLAVALHGGEIYAGGSFNTISGVARPNFAGFQDVSVGVTEQLPERPSALLRAAPNPFRSGVTLRFALQEPADARLEIYDVAGRQVRSLYWSGRAGEQTVDWDGRDEAGGAVAAGVYFVRLTTGTQHLSAKVLRVK
ncbi:MAG: FlgD immunoglobulin-like domain containing protein [Candidatus Eiseniibacteriota bacterium]